MVPMFVLITATSFFSPGLSLGAAAASFFGSGFGSDGGACASATPTRRAAAATANPAPRRVLTDIGDLLMKGAILHEVAGVETRQVGGFVRAEAEALEVAAAARVHVVQEGHHALVAAAEGLGGEGAGGQEVQGIE